jgi:single-strand DNA-binding protein
VQEGGTVFIGNPVVTIVGGLVATPEVKFTPGGHALAAFTLVSTDRKRMESGAWEDVDKTYWNCVAWRRTAENLAESDLKPGDKVIAIGVVRQENWEDKEGNKRSTMKFTAEHVGVALDYNSVSVKRADRSATPSTGTPADPWAASDDDKPPF